MTNDSSYSTKINALIEWAIKMKNLADSTFESGYYEGYVDALKGVKDMIEHLSSQPRVTKGES